MQNLSSSKFISRWLLLFSLVSTYFIQPVFAYTLSKAEKNFLISLGQNYRLGLEYEMKFKNLKKIAKYYQLKPSVRSVYYKDDYGKAMYMAAMPDHFELREDNPDNVQNVLKYFELNAESGLPDIEFALRDDVPDEIKRNPLAILDLQERFIKLTGIETTLNDPFSPYVGISHHLHVSRWDDLSAPAPFDLSRILAHFDLKAATIISQGHEDLISMRGVYVFEYPKSMRGQRKPQPISDFRKDPDQRLTTATQLKQHHTITNMRGDNDNWIEDKAQILPPDRQLVLTLQILEGAISIEEIYAEIESQMKNSDLFYLILSHLHRSGAAHEDNLGSGFIMRCARYCPSRSYIQILFKEALLRTKGLVDQVEIFSALTHALQTKEDKEFFEKSLQLALAEDPEFLSPFTLKAYRCATALR